jgi:hypothetical protein
VNPNEIKQVLLLYRPGTADAEDPEIAEALAQAKRDPELARWLEDHCARQERIRAKFRQMAPPAGLKEQIISEQAAQGRTISWRPRLVLAALVAVLLVITLATFWIPRRANDDTLAIYRNQMVGLALRGYGMDLTTNDHSQIRAYLAQRKARADYVLPAGLQNVAVTGCAIEGWQNAKVSMICFRTGRPLPPNQSSDMWLFVVERASLKDAPEAGQIRLVADNRLTTAVWTQGDTVYLLGMEGDESAIRKFL